MSGSYSVDNENKLDVVHKDHMCILLIISLILLILCI